MEERLLSRSWVAEASTNTSVLEDIFVVASLDKMVEDTSWASSAKAAA